MASNRVSGNCEHYLRKCLLVSPCCGKVYPCRLCHDSKENHKLIRFDVKIVDCLQCGKRQEVSPRCKNCLITFGKYFCGICNLFDDNSKGQYHCNGCGICRTGGEANYFHCNKCGTCLNKYLKDSHQCVENSSRNNCPICLEDLHTSTVAAHVPQCGHLLHSTCFKDFTKSGGYSCPTCNKCLFNMSDVWSKLDTEVAQTPMPAEYNNFEVRILCRDCQKHSKIKFHVVGLKCSECGSYNTCRDDDDNEPLNPLIFEGNLEENEVGDIETSEESEIDDNNSVNEMDNNEDGEENDVMDDNNSVNEMDNNEDVEENDVMDDNGSVQSDFSLD